MGKKQIKDKNMKNPKKKKTKKKTWKKVLLIIVLILLITGGVFAYKVHLNGGGMSGMLATMVGHDQYTKKNLGEFKVLLLGISTDQENVDLTDTIMVASYNPNTQKATLLSIPRDTYTGKNPAKATSYEKINALYNRKHRPDETLEAVNEITGLNIEYYVVIKTEALIKLVDVIGGVTFNVPIDMDYDDTSQNLHIHLKAGEQKLDGDKAEQVVRFRHNNNGTSYPEEYGDNDTGRMRTQREFIMQVVKQTAKPENIFKLGQILDVAKEYIITNIDFNIAKDYIPYIVEFNTDDLLTETLPGTSEEANTDTATIDVNKSDITVEVLNGSGTASNLQKVVSQLQGAGFKVTRTGSTNTTPKTTINNKKSIKETLLKNIKDVIGQGDIQSSESSSSKVDVTIIIGKDY